MTEPHLRFTPIVIREVNWLRPPEELSEPELLCVLIEQIKRKATTTAVTGVGKMPITAARTFI